MLGLLTNKNIKIPIKKNVQGPPMQVLAGQGRNFQKMSSETSDMTSEGFGEMFEGDFADTCADKFPLVSMGD